MASRRPSGPFDQLAEYFADHPRALLSLQIVPPLVFVFFFVFVPLASIFAWSFWTVDRTPVFRVLGPRRSPFHVSAVHDFPDLARDEPYRPDRLGCQRGPRGSAP